MNKYQEALDWLMEINDSCGAEWDVFFMSMMAKEIEKSYKTKSEEENHISKAIEQESSIMGMKISQFNIIDWSDEE